MTLLEIEQDVYRRCDKNVTNPDAVTKARIDTFINDRYRELCRLVGILDIREESFSFTTESGRARYALPLAATAITSIVDTQNRIKLTQRSLSWIRDQDPSVPAQVTGTPWVYAVLNNAGVAQQPTITTASALEIVSTSNADDGTVEIEYQDAGGGFNIATVAMQGTTPAAIAIQASLVFRAVANPDGSAGEINGTITIRQVADSRVILTIPRNRIQALGVGPLFASAQWVIRLWPTPNGAIAYVVDGSRPRAVLVQPDDIPIIPEEFHTLLVYGACEEEMLKMDDDRRSDFRAKWDADVKRLRAYLHQDRGQRLIPSGGRNRGWSDLGPYFPANRGGW